MARHSKLDREDLVVLGTDVVLGRLNGKPSDGRFNEEGGGISFAVTFLAVGAIHAWAAQRKPDAPKRWLRAQRLLDRVAILPCDERVAEKWRTLYSREQLTGAELRDVEDKLGTVACCLVRRLMLVTYDRASFAAWEKDGLVLSEFVTDRSASRRRA